MILYVSIMRSSISEPLIQIHWCPKTDSECATSKCSKVPQDRRSCSTFFQCFSIPWIGNIAKPLLGYPPASGWEWIHHPLGLFHHHLWRAPRIHGHSMEIPWRWCHECHERLKTGWNQQDFGWSQGGFPILSDGSVMVRSPSAWLLAQLPSSVVPTGVWQDHHGWDRGLLRCPTSPEFMSIPTVEAFFFFGCTPMFIHKFMNVNSGCWNSKVAYLPWFTVILNHVISTIQELDQSI